MHRLVSGRPVKCPSQASTTRPDIGAVTRHASRPARIAATLVTTLIVAACSAGDGRTLPPARDPLPTPSTSTSTSVATSLPGPALRLDASWATDGRLPSRYGCPTEVATPALSWTGVPESTVELAVVFSTGGIVDHVLVGIEPTASGLTEDSLPSGAFWWPPSEVDAVWPGLCAADGNIDGSVDHQFTVYALNQQLEAADDTAVTDLVGLLALTAVGQATVTGRLDVPATT